MVIPVFPRVSIIILNWNGWRDTVECLESLYRITYPSYDVILVDNASKDDSIERIKEYVEGKIEVNSKFFNYSPYNKPIKVFEISEDEARQGKFNKPLYEKYDVNRRLILIRNKGNYGFAGGNNVGIKFALSVLNPEYVLLLNNDTIVDKRFLDELVKVAESDEKLGIVGPKIYYYDYYGRNDIIWSSGGSIHWWLVWVYSSNKTGVRDSEEDLLPEDVEWISGAALMMNTKYFRWLNPNYFFGNEDVELGINARQKGLRVVYVPKSKVWHKVGVSRKKAKVSVKVFEGYFKFIKANFPLLIYIYQILINTLLIPLRAMRNKDLAMFYYLLSKFRIN
ncbi:glycosyltransferase family 2 protein [Thermococcus sp. LS1]|uniref:glycosyltransferase family 2 protein n=1 Tax=Thermococcus sp. LS1 TaxID=1638259 RepID=UPI001438730C|nr:glycosyltransferase family 2 protein [Thermococcus sp. LS1]NJD98900.1 glycosyltransferase family 2 protein [Thermococcus sp. LS1]